jgi:hypothetical protein
LHHGYSVVCIQQKALQLCCFNRCLATCSSREEGYSMGHRNDSQTVALSAGCRWVPFLRRKTGAIWIVRSCRGWTIADHFREYKRNKSALPPWSKVTGQLAQDRRSKLPIMCHESIPSSRELWPTLLRTADLSDGCNVGSSSSRNWTEAHQPMRPCPHVYQSVKTFWSSE